MSHARCPVTNKRSHDSEVAAKGFMDLLTLKHGVEYVEWLNIYKCKDCPAWHIGHVSKMYKRRKGLE